MTPRPLDTLLAFKAIALTDDLSGTEKEIAGAIVDHYNRKTGRCDPSLGRIASLVRRDRRTVIRALHRIESERFVRKIRHGGRFNSNSYQPNWTRFHEVLTDWTECFHVKRQRLRVTTSSRHERQACHASDDTDVIQTFFKNLSKETYTRDRAAPLLGADQNKHSRKISGAASSADFAGAGVGTSSHDAAFSAAERRWMTATLSYGIGQFYLSQKVASNYLPLSRAAWESGSAAGNRERLTPHVRRCLKTYPAD